MVSTQRWTSMQGLRVSAARAGSAVLNSASFILAASSVKNAGIHGDGYAEAGLSGACFMTLPVKDTHG
jgi:hypothetical protein